MPAKASWTVARNVVDNPEMAVPTAAAGAFLGVHEAAVLRGAGGGGAGKESVAAKAVFRHVRSTHLGGLVS